MQAAGARPHAALLASPGLGHLIPVLELGKRLVAHHDIAVTIFFVSTDAATANSLLKSCPATLSIVPLPAVDISDHVDPSEHAVIKLISMMRHSVPNLRSTVSRMHNPPAALIVDVFGTEAFSVADEFGMLKYAFVTSTAWFLAVAVYGSSAEEEVACHVNLKKPLVVPGCRPVRFEVTLDAYEEAAIGNYRVYQEFQRVGVRYTTADGILLNTWEELEVKTLEALRNPIALKNVVKAPIYPVGPLVRPLPSPHLETNINKPKSDEEVRQWLDKQPSKSVIYVSFGSGGTLSRAQLVELAWGLELSGHRFVWVVRSPPADNDISATFFSLKNGLGGPHTYLPDGFLSRTQDRGLVLSMWAPQAEILVHPSVGRFLSHCGWNSTLECITNGMPMVVWPLYAEQKLNAALLVEELRVALRPESNNNGGVADVVVKREEIERVVRRVMADEEGKEIRKRAMELKESGERALSKKLKGSSVNRLSHVARDIELNLDRLKACQKRQRVQRGWDAEN